MADGEASGMSSTPARASHEEGTSPDTMIRTCRTEPFLHPGGLSATAVAGPTVEASPTVCFTPSGGMSLTSSGLPAAMLYTPGHAMEAAKITPYRPGDKICASAAAASSALPGDGNTAKPAPLRLDFAEGSSPVADPAGAPSRRASSKRAARRLESIPESTNGPSDVSQCSPKRKQARAKKVEAIKEGEEKPKRGRPRRNSVEPQGPAKQMRGKKCLEQEYGPSNMKNEEVRESRAPSKGPRPSLQAVVPYTDQQRFKLMEPLHLGMNLKIGAEYDLADLQRRCKGNAKKLEKLDRFVIEGSKLVEADAPGASGGSSSLASDDAHHVIQHNGGDSIDGAVESTIPGDAPQDDDDDTPLGIFTVADTTPVNHDDSHEKDAVTAGASEHAVSDFDVPDHGSGPLDSCEKATSTHGDGPPGDQASDRQLGAPPRFRFRFRWALGGSEQPTLLEGSPTDLGATHGEALPSNGSQTDPAATPLKGSKADPCSAHEEEALPKVPETWSSRKQRMDMIASPARARSTSSLRSSDAHDEASGVTDAQSSKKNGTDMTTSPGRARSSSSVGRSPATSRRWSGVLLTPRDAGDKTLRDMSTPAASPEPGTADRKQGPAFPHFCVMTEQEREQLDQKVQNLVQTLSTATVACSPALKDRAPPLSDGTGCESIPVGKVAEQLVAECVGTRAGIIAAGKFAEEPFAEFVGPSCAGKKRQRAAKGKRKPRCDDDDDDDEIIADVPAPKTSKQEIGKDVNCAIAPSTPSPEPACDSGRGGSHPVSAPRLAAAAAFGSFGAATAFARTKGFYIVTVPPCDAEPLEAAQEEGSARDQGEREPQCVRGEKHFASGGHCNDAEGQKPRQCKLLREAPVLGAPAAPPKRRRRAGKARKAACDDDDDDEDVSGETVPKADEAKVVDATEGLEKVASVSARGRKRKSKAHEAVVPCKAEQAKAKTARSSKKQIARNTAVERAAARAAEAAAEAIASRSTCSHTVADADKAAGENPKAEEFKVEDSKADAPMTEEPQLEEANPEEPTAVELKAAEPATDGPMVEEPELEEPKSDEHKAEERKTVAPTAEESQLQEAKSDEPKAEDIKADETKAEAPVSEEPQLEETKSDEPEADAAMGEEPKLDEANFEPKTEELKAEEPGADEPMTKEPQLAEATARAASSSSFSTCSDLLSRLNARHGNASVSRVLKRPEVPLRRRSLLFARASSSSAMRRKTGEDSSEGLEPPL